MDNTNSILSDFGSKDVISFFGKTGVGKTSTINTLFSLSWPTDNAKACTTNLNFHRHITNTGGEKLIIDIPGISESIDADEIYYESYIQAVSHSGTVVWILQGDSRVYRPDQIALLKLQRYFPTHCRFILGLNQIDRIHGSWNDVLNSPSVEQSLHIKEKVNDIHNKFNKYFEIFELIEYSSLKMYNINCLYNSIIS